MPLRPAEPWPWALQLAAGWSPDCMAWSSTSYVKIMLSTFCEKIFILMIQQHSDIITGIII
jgi:hypothetical protein